jgi:hypothetical protein
MALLPSVDDEALSLDRVDVLADCHYRDSSCLAGADDTEAVEVEVHPADGADLADAEAGAEGEADEVGHVGLDRDPVGVGELEEPAALLDGQAAWGSGLVAAGRLDAFELPDRVRWEDLVKDGLVHCAGDDCSDHAAGVGGVGRLLLEGAVAVLDGLAGLFEVGEERVEAGDCALDEPELAELGEYLLVQAVPVGVGGRVGAALLDLGEPDRGGLPETGVLTERHRLGDAAAFADRVLESLVRRALGRRPAVDRTGRPVEISVPATGEPLPPAAGELDLAMAAERERWPSHPVPSPAEFSSTKRLLDLRKANRPDRQPV